MKRFLNDQCTCFCLTTDRLCTSVFCFQIVQFTEIKGSGIADIHTCRIFAIFDQIVAKITFFTFFSAFINGRCAKRIYLCTCSATDAALRTGKTNSGVVTYNVDMTQYEDGKKVRVWLPVAQDTDYQTIKDVTYDVNGAEGKITEDALGNKMLYIEWDKDTAATDHTVTCSFHVDREEILRPELKEEGEPGTDLDEYLEASSTIPVDGVVKETADEITKGKDTYLDKARAIYDWIIANMNRDESVKGCGQGDVCALQSPMISFHRQI